MSDEDKKLEKEKAKAEKKRLKAQIKTEKKAAKAKKEHIKKTGKQQTETAQKPRQQTHQEPSIAVKFAETVRGVLFLVLAVSLVIAIILSDQGYIITLEDIVQSLILAWVGKAILATVAVGFFIWGLKTLRAIK